jgi:hypothetical protein
MLGQTADMVTLPTVNKKVPSNAIAPTTAHTAVTTLEVKLSNMRALPFVWFVRRQSHGQISDKHRKAIHVAADEFFEGQWIHGFGVSDRSAIGPSSCPYSPECVEGGFCELRRDGVLRSSRHRQRPHQAAPNGIGVGARQSCLDTHEIGGTQFYKH